MLVARSFGYTKPRQQRSADSSPIRTRDHNDEPENEVRAFGWKPPSFKRQMSEPLVSSTEHVPLDKRSMALPNKSNEVEIPRAGLPSSSAPVDQSGTTASTTMPSKPVAVPMRRAGKNTSQSTRISSNLQRAASSGFDSGHDSQAMPASVAALLAITNIPSRRAVPRISPRSMPKHFSKADLEQEWRQLSIPEDAALASSPTMDLLLAPPSEDDFLQRTSSSNTLDETLHSTYSASTGSTPSLDEDDFSILSSTSPVTPKHGLRRSGSKTAKPMSVTNSVESTHDHPLLHSPEPLGSSKRIDFRKSRKPPRRAPSSSSSTSSQRSSSVVPPPISTFKSNLTTSLAALRAISAHISNFAAPSIPPSDHIHRGIFFDAPLRPEMRPRLAPTPDEPLSPALRRYLNPLPRTPHAAFHASTHPAWLEHADPEAMHRLAAPADAHETPIPLADLRRPRRVPTHAQTPAPRPAMPEPLRRREPRENSDFLRVCVLEMSMRRAGKLEPGAGEAGRGIARFWLPPRRDEPGGEDADGEADRYRDVPRRWVGISHA